MLFERFKGITNIFNNEHIKRGLVIWQNDVII